MKLSFSTLGCPEWSLEHIVKNAREMGYDAVELRGVKDQLRTERLDCMKPEKRAETGRLLKQYGISLCGVGTSVQFHEKEKLEDAMQEGRSAIRLCTEMEIPFIRVFGNELPGNNFPGNGLSGKGYPEEDEREAVMRRVEEGIGELCAYASALRPGRPVQVLLEVHGDFNSLPVLSRLCRTFAEEPAFGLIWDVYHSWLWHGDNFLPFYEALRPFIRHVHIKDCVMEQERPKLCLPGEGVLPLKAVIGRLRRDDYDGFYSFEWEKRWHPELPEPERALPLYVDFMRALEREG
ncbi:MAG TPA: sugar phosphate isomerase/epimerase [Candidatus Eisenbergiella intestinipullorum]|nr:sugar phosphate isomerase/epimerase [Candidatus Eisenbergiella intestinipullorum]